MSDAALLTFSIGPVHTFIGQARRIADLWAGSEVLSDLTQTAITALLETKGAALVFPRATRDALPKGLPNRFVARVPIAQADAIAKNLEAAIDTRWAEIVEHGAQQLRRLRFDISLERHPWKDAIRCAWSWVPDRSDYKSASRAGAELFAASRVYRPFEQTGEAGMKCAICGERNALPDGDRCRVTEAWEEAMTCATEHENVNDLIPYVRGDQTRLCLVCSAKRFYPTEERPRNRRAMFDSFEDFQPKDSDGEKRDRPYFALVTMDGDRLGEALRNSTEEEQGEISAALSTFAESLRKPNSTELNLETLGIAWPGVSDPKRHRPQLIYAGGEDVLFVSDPRDALACAAAVRQRYGECFADRNFDRAKHTISAAIIFGHTKIPAGRLLHDAEDLLKRRAKTPRNAIAVALHKRSGRPVETLFPWEGSGSVQVLSDIVAELHAKRLASRQMYSIAEEHHALTGTLTETEQWKRWLEWRLTRGEGSRKDVATLAALLAPLFAGQEHRLEALRIARFLAFEAETKRSRATAAATGGAA